MTAKKITLEEFLSDPKYQDDRSLIEGVVDAHIKKKLEDKNTPDEEKGFLESIFGGK